VLESLAQHGRASGSSAHQETLAARIGKSPDQVANALEPKHRVKGKEGDRRHVIVRIGSAGGGKRRHRAGFSNAFFQDLAVFFFTVVEQDVRIVRLIKLPLAGIDAYLPD